MGNPHAIFWVDDVNAYDLDRFGPLLENHPIFPDRANITLAHIVDRDHITMRTWERGAGLTRACGSAACATAVAAARLKRTNRIVTMTLPGGKLSIEWRERDDHVLMTGTATFEYEGRFDPALFANPSPDDERRRPHLRLPPQRLRIRSDPRARRSAPALTDTIVINSCAVTNEAVAQARQSIRRLKRERPDARIVVTGCAAQTQPEMFAEMPEVDRVVGNDEKMRGQAWRDAARRSMRRLRHRDQRKDRGRRHHVGQAKWRRICSTASRPACRASSCRCRTAATTAAPSASSPTAAAIRARCRWARWSIRSARWSSAAMPRSC